MTSKVQKILEEGIHLLDKRSKYFVYNKNDWFRDDWREISKNSVETPEGSVAAYRPPGEGAVKCDRCMFYAEPNRCSKPEVLRELGPAPNEKSLAPVDPKGWCNFFRRREHGED